MEQGGGQEGGATNSHKPLFPSVVPEVGAPLLTSPLSQPPPAQGGGTGAAHEKLTHMPPAAWGGLAVRPPSPGEGGRGGGRGGQGVRAPHQSFPFAARCFACWAACLRRWLRSRFSTDWRRAAASWAFISGWSRKRGSGRPSGPELLRLLAGCLRLVLRLFLSFAGVGLVGAVLLLGRIFGAALVRRPLVALAVAAVTLLRRLGAHLLLLALAQGDLQVVLGGGVVGRPAQGLLEGLDRAGGVAGGEAGVAEVVEGGRSG